MPHPAGAEPDGTATTPTDAASRIEELLGDGPVPGLAPEVHEVTLITGDRVTLTAHGEDGPYDVDVEPASRPDGPPPTFLSQVGPDGVYVIPSDVQEALYADLVDWELFNVSSLVEQGYADAESDALPVIVAYPRPAAAALRGLPGPSAAELAHRADRLPATSDAVGLASVNGAGVSVAKDQAAEFWQELGVASDRRSASERPRVWLDSKSELLLDQSAPLIGAPQAWAAGYDGSGVTVAVLDSGVDLNHPDLVDRLVATESFVDGLPPQDHHGHGTHVASTIAGTGAASDGRYTGVAPGADLVTARVCSDEGGCSSSAIIAGMEWATQQMGADIVSMSLGGGPTNGTDPLSMAVNNLTATTGALFVIAAGNHGADRSVAAPGAADAALTVAATDKSDRLAGFSSRGPRWGDLALKPDIAAPGVEIIAARAAGTDMGGVATPIDDFYVSANGTSMATPHVSGAAAILAQRFPDWTAAQLKAALMSTAFDAGHTVYQQGAGRADVARAVTQQVFATTPNVDFRNVPLPHEGEPEPAPITKQVTYTNVSDQPVTLTLTASLATTAGEAVPAGALTAPATVTVPAGGEATVPVTLDVAGLGAGWYAGALVASDPTTGTSLRTPVGLVREPPKATLTIRTIGRDGLPATAVGTSVVDVAGSTGFITEISQVDDGVIEVRLPEGVYSVAQAANWIDEETRRNFAWLFNPEVVVDGDTEIILDARTATQVTFDTPLPSEPLSNDWHSWYERTDASGQWFAAAVVLDLAIGGAWRKLWATPTEPVTIGEFRFISQWLTGKDGVDMTVLGPQQRELSVATGPFALTWGQNDCQLDDSCVPTYGSGGIRYWHRDYIPFDGTEELTLADAGRARPEDLAGQDLTGKLALLEYEPLPTCGINIEQLEAVRDAGAAAVLAFPTEDSNCQIPTVVDQPQLTGPARPIGIRFAFLPIAEGRELRAQLTDGPLTIRVTGTPETPYTYVLKTYEEGRVPESLHYTYTEENLATYDLDFHASEPSAFFDSSTLWKQEDMYLPSLELASGGAFIGPRSRREYVGLDPEVLRIHQVTAGAVGLGQHAVSRTIEVLDRPVHVHQRFNTVPMTPGALVARPGVYELIDPDRSIVGIWGVGNTVCALCREGNVMVLVNNLVTGDPAAQLDNTYDAARESTYRLYRDGVELPSSALDGFEHIRVFQLPEEPGSYRVELEVDPGEAGYSRTEAAWTFESGPPTEEGAKPYGYTCPVRDVLRLHDDPCAPTPAVFVSYDLGESLALDNTVKAPGAHWFDVYAYHHPSPLPSPAIAGLKLWASYDGGDRWVPAQVRNEGDGKFRVKLVHPPARGHDWQQVSLKVEAWDVEGNRVEVVTYDAFQLRDGHARPSGGAFVAS
ncbi:MAG TPA: S8 family serine peptidase [Natronosporangium sp.]